MAPASFSLRALPARFVKAVMVAVVLPFAIGLLASIRGQLELVRVPGATFREWVEWGFVTYVGLHVLLFRPTSLFRVSRQVFSSIAVWLFGGQVTSVEDPGDGKGSKKGSKSEAKSGTNDQAAEGSTLVAFSPYVVPIYTVLVCAAGWMLDRWWSHLSVDGPLAFCIGLTLAFHWLMTADELQQQRRRWHLETYLLALSLVFVLTLLVAAACLPWAVPEVSFVRTLAEGFSRAQAIYASLLQRLFF